MIIKHNIKQVKMSLVSIHFSYIFKVKFSSGHINPAKVRCNLTVILRQNHETEDDSDIGEDMLQMVDEDDIEFLKEAVNNRSYNFLKRARVGYGR